MLSGIDLHKELGQEQFLGALYAEQLSNDVQSVKLNLIIDGKGNIKAITSVEESNYALLNKAAIKESAPFPPLLDAIASNEIKFSVPIKFALVNPS